MVNIFTLQRTFRSLGHVRYISKFIEGLFFLIYNSRVSLLTDIGKGSFCAYGGIGVVIHKRAVIGRNCTIGQNVTIGGRNGIYNVPTIHDNVFIGPNSVILGDIVIESDSVVGAGSIVLKSIKKGEVWAGNPARKIR